MASPITLEQIEGVSEDEKLIVGLLDSIKEHRLAKAFSRKKTQSDFLETLSDDDLKTIVRPYIDKQIVKALEIIGRANVGIYHKDARYQNINASDKVDIAPLFRCKPKFFFTLTEDGTIFYTLKASDGVEDLNLNEHDGVELTTSAKSPAVFVANSTLYSFSGVEATKFHPFFKSKNIKVEARIAESYMEKFVMQCVRQHNVRAFGFDVVRHESPMRPMLKATSTIIGYGMSLGFEYGSTFCSAASRDMPTTLTRKENGGFRFDSTIRQFSSERKITEAITHDQGLRLENGVLFLEGVINPTIIDIVDWCNIHRQYLEENNFKMDVDVEGVKYYVGDYNLATSITKKNDWFDIAATVTVGQWEIPFSSFANNIRNGNRIYSLPDGSIFVLPEEWFEEWRDILSLATINPDGSLKAGGSIITLLPHYMLGGADNDMAKEMTLATFQRQGGVQGTLRTYQEEGVRWMVTLAEHNKGGILADDMGLGKTIQTAALFSHVYSQEATDTTTDFMTFNRTGLAPSLIVMPASLVFNWQAELHKFTPHLKTYVYSGKQAIDGSVAGRLLNQYHVVLTTYAQVRIHAQTLSQIKFLYVVLDESHVAKNPTSKTYDAIANLQSTHRLNLSGTPVENSLKDLWAQFNLINPGLLGSRSSFEHGFVLPIEKHGDVQMAKRLRQLTAPFILRRTKQDVLSELPPLTVQTISCNMTESQREVYEREKSACRNMLLKAHPGDKSTRFASLQALTKLRLMANHPALCSSDYEGDSGKTDVVMNHIANIASMGHKMLVFSSFVRDLDMIASKLTDAGIGWEKLTGQTSNREEVINRFCSSQTKNVFLISLKAGGVGLNLTCADYVLILNPWWNPAAEAQAYNRAHRHGQTQSVTVYRFITVDTIEEKIDKMQQRKLNLADTAIGAMPTDEELASLLLE